MTTHTAEEPTAETQPARAAAQSDTPPNPMIERARKLADAKLDAVRTVAETRAALEHTRRHGAEQLAALQRQIAEQTAAAERADARAFTAAKAAGWTLDELRKIGITEPEKATRTRRGSDAKARR